MVNGVAKDDDSGKLLQFLIFLLRVDSIGKYIILLITLLR